VPLPAVPFRWPSTWPATAGRRRDRRTGPPRRCPGHRSQGKSEAKTKAAEQAIRSLVKRGQPITFQAVQREAGVSHAFLYGHPELRGRIECLRAQARPAPIRADPAESADTLVLALTSQISQLKKRHRQEVHELRAALEQAHGENLELRRELTRRGWTAQPAAT
jgi:hypothetical protein